MPPTLQTGNHFFDPFRLIIMKHHALHAFKLVLFPWLMCGFLLLSLALSGCGPTAEERIEQMEAQLQAMSTDPGQSPFSPAFQSQADQLVQAYLGYVDEQPKAEAAPGYLLQAARYSNDFLENPRKAVALYQRFRQLYPQRPAAADALFNIGWIHHNGLKDTLAARNAYETFLQQYPEHELAESARFELDNLGLTDEELFDNLSPAPSE